MRSRAARTWEAAGVGQCALWPRTQSIHRDKLLWGGPRRERPRSLIDLWEIMKAHTALPGSIGARCH